MSRFIKDLVEIIEMEINSVSPYGSLDNVEDEIKELIDVIKNQDCTHCNLNIDDIKEIIKPLPCPLCGNNILAISYNSPGLRIHCSNCELTVSDFSSDEQVLIRKWNRRYNNAT